MLKKVWILHETLVFSVWSSGHKDVSSENIAESISGKVLQEFCSKSENQNKKLIFQKKVAGIFLLDTWIVVLNSTENHSAKLKKIEFSSKLCFLSERSPRHRGSRCDNSTQCFCSKSKHGENLKTVSFSLLFPQNVPLEMMNANLTTLPISFEVAKEFHIMCGNDKKTLIFPTRFNFSALLHWTRKGSLTILPKVFRPNSEISHFCKSFRKIVFFKNFLWTSKSHFWQACRNHFCQKLY